MNYCKTCIHFDNSQGWSGEKDDGMCNRLGSNDNIVADAHFNQFITFHKDGNPQSVHVGCNFGCIHHDEETKQ
jgi:hypothetical protein